MKITSVSNDIVKETVKLQQKKYRTQTKQFLLEGYKAIKEAFDCEIELVRVFVNEKYLNEYSFIKDNIIETTDVVLKKLSTTDSAPEAVAVGVQKDYDKKLLTLAKKVVLLENIKDLGNLGTIIRSSLAFGADALILYGDSVDIYNPKCVRASVGNLWKLPIYHLRDINELKDNFANYKRVATLPRSQNLLKSYKVKLPVLVMFGSEADGLSDELIEFATDSVKIEMAKTVESLNLATSVSVILYQLFVD